MSKRAEAAALKAYPEKMGMFHEADIHYEADLNKAARIKYIEGYEQAEKDMMLEMKQWILRQRGFGKVALQDFEKYMRGNGHE